MYGWQTLPAMPDGDIRGTSGRKIWRLGATMGPSTGTPGTLPPSAPWSVRSIVCLLAHGSTPAGIQLYACLPKYSRMPRPIPLPPPVLQVVSHYISVSGSTLVGTTLYAGLHKHSWEYPIIYGPPVVPLQPSHSIYTLRRHHIRTLGPWGTLWGIWSLLC